MKGDIGSSSTKMTPINSRLHEGDAELHYEPSHETSDIERRGCSATRIGHGVNEVRRRMKEKQGFGLQFLVILSEYISLHIEVTCV